MAKMTLTYEDLYSEVSHFLGLTVRGTAPTGTDLTTCQDIVNRGIRQFLYPVDIRGIPHKWQFLDQLWTFETSASQWKYSLPHDFSELEDTFYFDFSKARYPLLKREADQILDLRSEINTSGYPEFFAIVPSKYGVEVGTIYELWLHPTPSQAYTLSAFYRMDPVKMSAASDLVVGGIRVLEAVLESCLAIAEQQEDDVIGIHTQLAEGLVQKLIQFDTTTDSDRVGNLYKRGDYWWPRTWPRPRPILTNIDVNNVY